MTFLSHSCAKSISWTPNGNFFKFGTNVHLDSMNRLELMVKGQGYCDLASVSFLWMRYLNNLRGFLQIWHKCSLGLNYNLIGFQWSKVRGLGHCDLASVSFSWAWYEKALRKFLQIWHKCPLRLKDGHITIWYVKVKNPYANLTKFHTIVRQDKMMTWWHFISKAQRSTTGLNVLSSLDLTTGLRSCGKQPKPHWVIISSVC